MKLQTKMILAFTAVIMLTGIIQYFYFQQKIKLDFQQYLTNQEVAIINKLALTFENYYKTYNSFDNVETFLQSNPMLGRRHGLMQGQMQGNMMIYNLHWFIADETGTIISDSNDRYIGNKASTLDGIRRELTVNGTTIGQLIVVSENDTASQMLGEQYIQSTNTTILVGSIIGSIIAMFVAFILTKKITRPLDKLLNGITKVTKGDATSRVTLNTKDEFFQLAVAFNKMLDQLAENDKLRDKLMADVAHELRTPLSVIRGKLESFQEGVIQPDEKEIMLLVDEVYRLSRLVNDLQQLSLAEAGKLQLNKQPIHIYHFVAKVLSNFSAWTEEKGISIHLNGDSKDIILSIDEDRMTQVLVNFLDNAVRHTPINGKIEVVLGEDYHSNELIISINDNGTGIAPELLPYIFDRFSRNDSSRNREMGGTGLGLAIAKGYIEAHNGTITVDSKLGEGTTFYIRLPMS